MNLKRGTRKKSNFWNLAHFVTSLFIHYGLTVLQYSGGGGCFFLFPKLVQQTLTAANTAKESAFEWRKIEKFRLGLRSYILLYVAKYSLQLIA